MINSTVISIKHQNGAALVIGLLILLLTTMVAISASTNSNLQEKMAANSQNKNRAFQAAESGVDSQITEFIDGQTTMVTNAINEHLREGDNWPTDTVTMPDTDISTALVIKVVGKNTRNTGDSLSAEEGQPSIPLYVYELTSHSALSGSNAKVTINQGFLYH